MKKRKLIIGVATFGRSEYLKSCLNSLTKLVLPDSTMIAFILVDNNPEPQAELLLSSFQFPYQTYCFHEEERGIVHARNRILKEAANLEADYLAFIDDDEIADKEWIIQALISLDENYSVVTGPCNFIFEKPVKWLSHSRIFAHKKLASGEYSASASTRNVVFNMNLVTQTNLKFEPKLNWVGGSDTYFFIQARAANYRTYWNEDMWVKEQIPQSRSNLLWVLKRNVRMGGGRVHRQRLIKPNAVVAIREFSVGIWFILKGTLEAILFFWFNYHFIRGIERATRGIGIFYALLGFKFKEYKSHHGN